MASITENSEKKGTFRERFLQPLTVPLLAIFTSLFIGALVILVTADSFSVGLEKLGKGYWGMFEGAFLKRNGIINTLVVTSPLILTGLAVAVPFRAGLFNIGAEGQFVMGGFIGVLAGIYLPLPPILHPIVMMLAGFLGGAIWGFIPGILRARLGAHEVINTIMLNFIAIAFVNYAVRGPFKDPNPSSVQTYAIRETAELARITGRFHWGVFVSVLMAVAVYYFLFKTTWGFSLRTTGQNPDAAEYAGIRSKRQFVLAMSLAGGLAGLAGSLEVQGLTHVVTQGFAAGYGFDAIAVSLLALNNPLAIIPAAILFGALRIGGDFLQIRAGLSIHLVSILQALILLFVSAPAIVRYLYRLKMKAGEGEGVPLTRGWGG